MKELLLFMTDFYGYNEEIINEIKKQGYNVTWFLDKISVNYKDKLLNKIRKNHIDKKFDEHFYSCIEKVNGKNFDKILIIFGGSFFKKKHIEILRQNFLNTEIVYYAWDSVNNFPLIENLLLNADKAFSFDNIDAKKYNVNFLPLFYVSNKNEIDIPKYDVSTVMSFFVEKSSGLIEILSILPKNLNNNIYLKLRDKIYYYKIKMFNNNKIKDLEKYFKFDKLSRNDVYNIFCDSKAIIDCPLPNQNGLTMRTFEVLALKRKLITTNKNIKEYDFYSPDNIYIIEDDREDIDVFLDTKFNENYKLDERYSLENFIKVLLNN